MALKVLSALDAAKTQFYHFKAIIIAGMGLFTDAYDLFCVPPIMKLIGRIYYEDVADDSDKYEIPAAVNSAMIGIALLGTVIGKLTFGYLGDRVGRRRVYGISLMLMVFSSIGCGFSFCRKRTCVLTSLGFFRFLLGVGIGGDYPLSATIMSEFANKKTRGSFIAAVFSMQGFGILVSSTVTMVVCKIFDHASKHVRVDKTPEVADLAWRIILVLGAVPAGMTWYWRMMMPETARYTALVERNVQQAAKDMEKVLDVSLAQIAEDCELPPINPPRYPLFSKQFFRRHGRDLFACAASWFLVDIVFYSSNLFQYQISNKYVPDKKTVNAYMEAYGIARHQAIIAICSTIPGYWATVFFIDRIGRVRIQIMGFFFMAVGLFAIGVPYYSYWDKDYKVGFGFMFLYGLTFFFSNFGPNTTTFIVPAELFPARFRSTCHGISGATGKVGAIIGSVGFMWSYHNIKEEGFPRALGMTRTLEILGVVCLVGIGVTFFFSRETMGRSLEENENEIDDAGSEFCFLGCFKANDQRTHSLPSEVEIASASA
ncbi:Major facilitator, sugar transporter-like [Dillenia turbinata]|uniref:Major facilitator, sugar transporter-like n=1 Tax=Dillenia turbinata TaxID=194707 RepID=A0AAN8VWR9_9MAGN